MAESFGKRLWLENGRVQVWAVHGDFSKIFKLVAFHVLEIMKICSLARISLLCGAAGGIWNCHMACRDATSNIVVAKTICAGQIVGHFGRL